MRFVRINLTVLLQKIFQQFFNIWINRNYLTFLSIWIEKELRILSHLAKKLLKPKS